MAFYLQLSILCIIPIVSVAQQGKRCDNPIEICSHEITVIQPDSFYSLDQIKPSCFGQASYNNYWFTISPVEDGLLEWIAIPHDVVEFDWALYDITNGCYNDMTLLRCNFNYSGPGNADPVGMLSSSTVECPISSVTNQRSKEYCQSIQVYAGNRYGILIDNFDWDTPPFHFQVLGNLKLPCDSFSCHVDVDLGPDKTYTDIVFPNEPITVMNATLDAGIKNATYYWSTGETTKTIKSKFKRKSDKQRKWVSKYWVLVDSAGCTGKDEIRVEYNLNIRPRSLYAYPNPTRDNFSIETYVVDKAEAEIFVYNTLGEKLYHKLIGPVEGELISSINLNKYAQGTYMVVLRIGDEITAEKVIKY